MIPVSWTRSRIISRWPIVSGLNSASACPCCPLRVEREGLGYSLLEVLVVLIIVGILATVGVTSLGSRPTQSVRSVLDELEGTLASAHQLAVSTGRDVTVAVSGSWSSTDPFLLAYGNATTATGTAVSASTLLATGATAAEAFRFLLGRRDYAYAGVVVAGSSWWATTASANTAICSVEPFRDSTSSFASLVNDPSSDTANLSAMGSVKISGVSKRFNSSFYIAVVGLRNGSPWMGGPMGLIVVLKNGATIYKFYNPGKVEGSDAWRKL